MYTIMFIRIYIYIVYCMFLFLRCILFVRICMNACAIYYINEYLNVHMYMCMSICVFVYVRVDTYVYNVFV